MSDTRHEEFYKDFALIAAFNKGQFQGRAWAKLPGLENLSAVGTSVPNVVEKLKALATAEVRRRSRVLRETLPERHRQFIEGRRVEFKGLRPITRTHRVSHCYVCKTIVDNAVDLECISCGWIVCTECAACGCGYTGVAALSNPSLQRTAFGRR